MFSCMPNRAHADVVNDGNLAASFADRTSADIFTDPGLEAQRVMRESLAQASREMAGSSVEGGRQMVMPLAI